MRQRQPHRFAGLRRAALLAGILCAAAPVAAIPPEVWVVAEQSGEVAILESLDPVTIEWVDLSMAGDPSPPYGIAFSTILGHAGEWAFVSQGSKIRTIRQLDRGFEPDVDLNALLMYDLIDLRGIEGALPEYFDAGGAAALRSYLHVAANVRLVPPDPVRPWYFVLDQEILAGLRIGNPIVAQGPLIDPPQPNVEAMEVTLLGTRKGADVQRAWYTLRDTSAASRLIAVEVGGRLAEGDWSTRRSHEEAYPVGYVVPESVRVGAPHSTELAILPRGPVANAPLLDLNGGRTCGFSPSLPPGERVRGSVATGPGLGSYTIWTAVEAPGSDGKLMRSSWDTCGSNAPIAIGENPTDLATHGVVEWNEVYVATRDSDQVWIVQDGNPVTVVPVDLVPGAASPCEKCPRSLAVVERPQTICRAVDLKQERISPTQVHESWSDVGCEAAASFKIWCRCIMPPCPVECTINCQDPLLTGELYCEVDVTEERDHVTSEGEQDGGNTNKNVEPNDDPP